MPYPVKIFLIPVVSRPLKFNEWKLAFIIDVDFEEVQSVRRLKLRMSSNGF